MASSTLTVPSPSPTANRRWTPLSFHGLPRTPKSATSTYHSSVSSPMSVATPSTFSSTRSIHSHRFDALSATTTAYSVPSYTSSITLSAPPARRPRLSHIPASPEGEAATQPAPLDPATVEPATNVSFCMRVFGRLGCGRGNSGSSGRSRKHSRHSRDDVVKIETVHWTEQ